MLLPKGRGSVLIGAVGAFPKLEGDAEIGYSTVAELSTAGIWDGGGARVGGVAVDAEGCEERERADLSESAGVDQGDGALWHEVCGPPGEDEGTVRYLRLR